MAKAQNLSGMKFGRLTVIHNINGIKNDNKPENLELWSRSQPAGTRVEDKIKWAIQILEQYAPQMIK
jgi:hypothetical protein